MCVARSEERSCDRGGGGCEPRRFVESEARAEADAAAAAGMIADELEAAGIVDDLPEDVDLETGEIRGEAA